MLPFTITQTIYIVLALAGGIAVTLAAVLTYWMIWRPRPPVDQMPATGWRGVFGHVPLVLALTYAGIVVYSILMLLAYASKPPNW